jgi:hypothetical protein
MSTRVEVPQKRSKKNTFLMELEDASAKHSFIVGLRKLKRLITTAEVMWCLKIKRRDTICKWVREGKLKAHDKVGNGYRFCPMYFANWIESHETYGFPKNESPGCVFRGFVF